MSGEGTTAQVLDGAARWALHVGDCRDSIAALPDSSVHAVICDPPYEINFMGSKWDDSGIAYNVALWTDVLRVLKPGGYLLAFGATRTFHRLAVAIENSGFQIRDTILWLYASGFPKSLNVSKALDREAGALAPEGSAFTGVYNSTMQTTAPSRGYVPPLPATENAQAWDGWGTALKPACEPIVMARKPLDGTVARNVTTHGTGAINVDACRVPASAADAAETEAKNRHGDFGNAHHDRIAFASLGDGERKNYSLVRPAVSRTDNAVYGKGLGAGVQVEPGGRWPANVIHDGSDEVLDAFAQFGDRPSATNTGPTHGGEIFGRSAGVEFFANGSPYANEAPGSAARFFFCAKASRAERELGCSGLDVGQWSDGREKPADNPRLRGKTDRRNTHATVKPIALLRHLIRLVTVKGGIVLDPFAGSGSCGIAALLEGARYLGAELEAAHVGIARGRLAHPLSWEVPEEKTASGATQLPLFRKSK